MTARATTSSLKDLIGLFNLAKTVTTSANRGLYWLQGAFGEAPMTATDTDVRDVVNALVDAVDAATGGAVVSGTPVAGQVPIASSATAAAWGFTFSASATVQNNGAASVLTQSPSTLAAITASRIALGHTQLTLPAAAPINLRAQVTAIGAVACGVSIVQTGDRIWDVYTVEAAGGLDVDVNYFVRFEPLV